MGWIISALYHRIVQFFIILQNTSKYFWPRVRLGQKYFSLKNTNYSPLLWLVCWLCFNFGQFVGWVRVFIYIRNICSDLVLNAVVFQVAYERLEKIGQSIGYQIRLESRVSPRTVLTYCTNGVLLRTLMGGDSSLTGLSFLPLYIFIYLTHLIYVNKIYYI